jgi:hypothetical protein
VDDTAHSLPIVLLLSEKEANLAGSAYRKRSESRDLGEFRLRRLDLFVLLRSVLSRHSARRKATNSFICRSNSITPAIPTLLDMNLPRTKNAANIAQQYEPFRELLYNADRHLSIIRTAARVEVRRRHYTFWASAFLGPTSIL